MSGRTKLSVSEERLEGITRGPLPASRKIYRTGTLHPEVRVPVRKFLTPTRARQGAGWVETPNAPVQVYDTSGPYTDPEARIDLRRGLDAVRTWLERDPALETLPEVTSAYGRCATQTQPPGSLGTRDQLAGHRQRGPGSPEGSAPW